ncbi:MAG: hypothetical protein QM778_29305 [Myxococcales bacterium]
MQPWARGLQVLAACWWLVAALWGATARAEISELPGQLVVTFEPSAAPLDQAAIRQALARELGMSIAESGSAAAPTLGVGIGAGGDLELTYQPERRRMTRSAALTASTPVPELVAQLASNMVRDEASQLLADLHEPAASAVPAAAAPPPKPSPSTLPAAALPNLAAEQAEAPWAVTLLAGGGAHPLLYGVLTLQVSRRFGRIELGLAVDGSAGRANAKSPPFFTLSAQGGSAGLVTPNTSDWHMRTLMTFAVPLSLDVDLLRREQGYLQLGARAGFAMAGTPADAGRISGSNAALLVGVRFTAGLRLRARRTLLLRGAWDVLPSEFEIPAGDRDYVSPGFGGSIQLGYAMGF